MPAFGSMCLIVGLMIELPFFVSDKLHRSKYESCSLFWTCSYCRELGKPLGEITFPLYVHGLFYKSKHSNKLFASYKKQTSKHPYQKKIWKQYVCYKLAYIIIWNKLFVFVCKCSLTNILSFKACHTIFVQLCKQDHFLRQYIINV